MTRPVLVTGATGFIGREIVRRLLACGRPVLALARGRDGVPAPERVIAAVGGLPGAASLEVVEGDLEAPDCGLGADQWRRLRATVKTVIHCAGDTTFSPEALAPYTAGHIDGPLRLLHGLAGGRLRRWAHLSTAYVCGRRSGTVLEREGDVGQDFHNTYERVKLESETVMRAAALPLGLDITVFRPSIVVGEAPATSGGNPSNLFFSFIRMVAALAEHPNGRKTRLRIEAAPRAPFNIVPIGYVAAAVIALAECPEAAGETFHLVVRDAPTQAEMLVMITERLGIHGLSFVDPLTASVLDPSPIERAVARMLEPYRPYLTQHVRFDDSSTARLLDRCVVPRAILSPDAVHRLIDLALVTRRRAVRRGAVHGEVRR